jgi:hypothetical protein
MIRYGEHLEDILKSITIHGVDDHLAGALKRLAEENQTSVNRTVKRLLEEVLGMKPRERARHYDDFAQYCGLWSTEELTEFEVGTADMTAVDPLDWS